jgi:hypothetical protein
LDNWNPSPGESVLLSVHNSPNPPGQPGGGDVIGFQWDLQWRQANYPQSQPHLPPGTNQNFAASFTMLDQRGDEVAYLAAIQYTENVGGITMGPIQLRPSQPITPPPTAPNTLTTPPGFSPPAHTYTVCRSGCNFTDWAAAVAAAADQDFVKITIGQSAYPTCVPTDNTAESHMPHHLWLQGVGGDFPVIGWASCVNKGTLVWGNGNAAGDGSALYVDNLRITNTACTSENDAGIRIDGPGDVFLRNVFVTGACMGLLSGDFPNNITIQNSRFARDGGNRGPSHNIYIGSGGDTSTLTISNSIIEQANNGYELKTRAKNTVLNCNIFRGDIDIVNIHSSDIHFAEGRESHFTNYLIYVGAAGQSASFAYYFFWGGDRESPLLTNNFMVATGNYFVEDYPVNSSIRNVMAIGNNPAATPWPGTVPSPSPPYAISPNAYVFAQDGSGPPTAIAQFAINDGSFTFPGQTIFSTRTAAGIPNVTYPIPAACTAPIGNLAIP